MLFVVLLATPNLLLAQIPIDCDSIAIGDIRYSATDAQVIEVSAASINGACIGYPSFNLYDQNGDTLAIEIPNFFCMSFGPNFGTHLLEVLPGAGLGTGPQNVTLELFGGFGDTLVCSWDLTVDLCPPDTCVWADVYMTDWHDQLSPADVYWYVQDATGGPLGTGIFHLNGMDRTAMDSVCLPPGSNYYMWVSPFTTINVMDSINLGVSSNYPTTGLINFHQNYSLPMDMHFNWYEDCADFTDDVRELSSAAFTTFQEGGSLIVVSTTAEHMEEVHLVDLHGKVVRSSGVSSMRTTLPIGTLAKGLYIVRAHNIRGAISSRKVTIR